jgi:hypothetical protein
VDIVSSTVFYAGAALAFAPALVCLVAYFAGNANLNPTPEQTEAHHRWIDRAGVAVAYGVVAYLALALVAALIYLF